MALSNSSEVPTEHIESIHFNFLTDEEIRRYSVKKITNPNLFDSMDRPVEGGLYDPALGSIEEGISCKSCGQRSLHCPGHCGHIDLVVPVYNPLLFTTLYSLLRKVCFFCYHFKLKRPLVNMYSTQLNLIAKGDIVGAKRLEDDIPSSKKNVEYEHNLSCKYPSDNQWTSLQYSEAKLVIRKFMKENNLKCENCGARSPKISRPTFGWIRVDPLTSHSIRSNVIRKSKLETKDLKGSLRKEDGISPSSVSSEVQTSDGSVVDKSLDSPEKTHKWSKENVLTEYFNQKILSGPLLPSEAKNIFKRLWENENQICSLIFDIQRANLLMYGKQRSCDMFFMEVLLVPATKFRPLSQGKDGMMDHPQNMLLGNVIKSNISLGNVLVNEGERSKIVPRWMELQQSINVLFDNKKSMGKGDTTVPGICQILEKKEGIFRQKMMGKRVNFACRSVISPDPYLAVNEIGIPPYFAERLTYPERVTPWNANKLRHAIINGPEIHPGATHYVDKIGTTILTRNKSARLSASRKLPSSRGAITNEGKGMDSEFEGKVVYRHLQDGDIVLVNRQPTLHKPSIMAHVVRVLKGEKTLRMHYANCSTYNADFDGDEMNVHFPQDEISRAEAYNIVNAHEQYIVPTSGKPIRGLIQDHIISAVLLTKIDTFLIREEYHQLLYSSCVSANAQSSFQGNSGKKISAIISEDEIEPILPAIWKPVPLWTGKQVITSILCHITRGRQPFTVENCGKIKPNYLGSNLEEKNLLIRKNELIHGVIDKAQFEMYGLVHTVQELYGSNTAGVLLSVFSRLFTVFLQMHGFTCGVDDLLIIPKSDKKRSRRLKQSEKISEDAHANFLGTKEGSQDPIKLQMELEKVLRRHGDVAVTRLDRMMSNALGELTSKVTNELLPNGLSKPFPKNCLSLMTTTGAKGSMVNFNQISSLLGQQELEGKRVPRMVSGKTLPCFPPWDSSSRAGGYIGDRYLTGLRPQEYYFHCMAGREGLVDTAVKTSRSGYLQRCLIKSLESLKVCYDHTVRDSDGSIVQFTYGEDGVDVCKTSFLTQFEMIAANQDVVQEKLCGKNKDARLHHFHGYLGAFPSGLEEKAKDYLNGLSKEKRTSLGLSKKGFMKLMKLKYLTSLAQPGEPVGIIAAQSVGEPSTQMTLNTFHFAGRGDMNVTLGIPRLQELLMRASEEIKTPFMRCPLKLGRTSYDAECLSLKLKKITVADIIESMDVTIVPFVVNRKQVSSIYKLKIKLYSPEVYPPSSNITINDCTRTLKEIFVPEMEVALQKHLVTLSKIRGIQETREEVIDISIKDNDPDDGQESKESEKMANADVEDVEDEDFEDLGSDAQKVKMQTTDEMDYEDKDEIEMSCLEDGHNSDNVSTGFKDESDSDDDDYNMGSSDHIIDEAEESSLGSEEDEYDNSMKTSKRESKSEIKGVKTRKKEKNDDDIAVSVSSDGLNFEVHFSFINKPHILLAEIAQNTAKRIYVKNIGGIEKCFAVTMKNGTPALQTAGMNFPAFWSMQDDLDVHKIESNDVHAMLRTYGVEAARATIINEVGDIFQSYGITVNIRHLTLIADFMTANGGYRPMSRFGMNESSTTPLGKITFETATNFTVQAALHGERETMESPSARICLGLPVKMGTGSFDLMQKLQM